MTKPIVKWAGGKRAIASQIVQHMPDGIHNYYEPFAGGAAVFLELHAAGKLASPWARVNLWDLNQQLINLYSWVLRGPDWVYDEVSSLPVSKEAYYQIREMYNQRKDVYSTIRQAARFLYLNKKGFNGLYRENAKGEFNVPYGSGNTAFDLPNMVGFATALRTYDTQLVHRDMLLLDPTDVVRQGTTVWYLDPPYIETFTGYKAGGFDIQAQEKLAALAKELASLGDTVLVSNSGCSESLRVYRGADKVVSIEAPRAMNRSSTTELLFVYEGVPRA